jgi:hypothetical protein
MRVIFDTEMPNYYTLVRHTSPSRRLHCSRSENGRLEEAFATVEKNFELSTGLPWSQRTNLPKYKKAIFINFENEADQSHEDLLSAVCETCEFRQLAPRRSFLLHRQLSPLLQKKATSTQHSVHTACALLRRISEVQNQPQDYSNCRAGPGQHALLLLCEVELGKQCEPSCCRTNQWRATAAWLKSNTA